MVRISIFTFGEGKPDDGKRRRKRRKNGAGPN